MSSKTENVLEVPVSGMDYAGYARTVRQAVAGVRGVCSADVLLSTEKAVARLDPAALDQSPWKAQK